MTTPYEQLLRALFNPQQRGDRQPTAIEPESRTLLIPDRGGSYSQQLLTLDAIRMHDGVVQVCRLKIALTVGDECRAVIELESSGVFGERVVRVEIGAGRVIVGSTTLAWYGGAAYGAEIDEFLRRQPWIEVEALPRARVG